MGEEELEDGLDQGSQSGSEEEEQDLGALSQ